MIDVIIPAYNANITIIKTLYSIIIQKNVSELQVTIVDDFSDEKYDRICDFFSKYVKIRTIRLESNSGPGVARQVGLENTNNPYIVFIDADDEFYDENSILNLYNSINDNDMSIGSMFWVKKHRVMYFNECLHAKMYRRSFLNENNIEFNNYRNHEDNAFNLLCLCLSKKINYVDSDKIIYKYNDIPNSITNTIDSVESIHYYIKCMNWLYSKVEQSNNKNIDVVYKFLTFSIYYLYSLYYKNPNSYSFILNEASFLKKEYLKYKDYNSNSQKNSKLMSINNNGTKIFSINEFINKIN